MQYFRDAKPIFFVQLKKVLSLWFITLMTLFILNINDEHVFTAGD